MTRQDLATIRTDLLRLQPEFATVLGNISPERFVRVTMTAIQRNPDLLGCTRRSLFLAVQQCAQDGLLPDGREAALVVYGNIATYMPMVAGLRRKLREHAEIADINAELVREGDTFDYQLGDDPKLTHKPLLNGNINRPITHVYTILRFKDGTVSRNVMHWSEVIMIRDRYARSRKGPWFDSAAIGEMGKKTCLKRHLKLQPMAPELEQLIDRDNEAFYDLEPREQTAPSPMPERTIAGALDAFAHEPAEQTVFRNAHPGEMKTKEDYIEEIKQRILSAETRGQAMDLAQLWETTGDERHVLGFTDAEEQHLGRHVAALQRSFQEEEEDDARGISGTV